MSDYASSVVLRVLLQYTVAAAVIRGEGVAPEIPATKSASFNQGACYDRGSTFRMKCFLNDGRVLNPKSSQTGFFFA